MYLVYFDSAWLLAVYGIVFYIFRLAYLFQQLLPAAGPPARPKFDRKGLEMATRLRKVTLQHVQRK